MKRILLFLYVSFIGFQLNAQLNSTLAVKRLIENKTDAKIVDVLVKGNIEKIKTFCQTHSVKVIGIAGDIASIRLSTETLALMLEKKNVDYAESVVHHYKPMNDTMRVLTRVEDVQNGLPPLTQSFRGRGVLMGIIDSGIDFRHPDFKDSLGNTRIQWLWDMTKPVAPNTPSNYGYGQEWNAADINAGNANAHTGEDQFGHGTYVAGIASGNGLANGLNRGVASESDMIVVGYDFSAQDTVPRIAHAVQYIFDKAQAIGKPVVINASLGDYYGSHDGLDLESQFIRNLIVQQPGRIVVAAAGNIGVNYPYHLGRNSVAGDTVFTWMKYNASIGGLYMQIFADTSQFRNVRFSIGADKVTPYYQYRGNIPFASITNILVSGIVNRTLVSDGNPIGRMQMAASRNGSVYSLEIYIIPDSTDYNWRFITTGNGRYDSWSFDWAWQSLPDSVTYAPMAAYHFTDTTQSIISGMACLDEVLMVGNYFNTDRHLDVDSMLQIFPNDKPRQLADNSSRGPTRDGRIKPDITAPGHHIMSAAVLSTIPNYLAGQRFKIGIGGYHISGGGTSASSPVVAGIAALYLEKNPNADWLQVKNALLTCAATDTFTWGPYPNNAWGAGKVDAMNTLNCSLVDVSDPATMTFITYPNPAQNSFNISGISIGNVITVSDLQGNTVSQNVANGSNIAIDCSKWATGLYFVKITGQSDKSQVGKVVVFR